MQIETQSFYIILNAFISHVGDVRDHIKYTLKKYIFLKTMSERSKTNKENHIQYMKDAHSGFIL